MDLVDGLMAFMEWLQELGGNIILVAHKCLDYDAKVLLRNLEEFEIPYSDIILGFSDSLLASRQLYTEVSKEIIDECQHDFSSGSFSPPVSHAVRGGASCEGEA